MDWLTLSFVGLLVVAGILLTLNIRGQILRAALARREQNHELEEEIRRKNAQHRSPRTAARR